jgi:hypothetical protein
MMTTENEIRSIVRYVASTPDCTKTSIILRSHPGMARFRRILAFRAALECGLIARYEIPAGYTFVPTSISYLATSYPE